MNPRVLLLLGSAKKPRSNSESLGAYLIEQLNARGFESETILLHQALWTDEARAALFAAVDRADLVALAFPLYVDTLPYLVTKTLELIAAQRANGATKRQRLVALVNCGFPEARHCDTAIAICRQFARETNFDWVGGLALGGGEVLNGRPLRELGGMTRHVVRALDLTADALAKDEPIPQPAIDLMAKPLVPNWMYTLIGGYGWKQRAKKFGAEKNLRARPYYNATASQ
jgi:hypothetical protein